ncbi:MAG: HAMP domain-containing protein [Desulfobacteraceae bacterium]|nr:MAG: HAMP domain-containing protein [Desulfobacteraceae bacterium]
MRSPFLHMIRSLSLKWKIVIPFLFFAFTGTILLSYIGLSSQQALIRAEEEREIFRYHNLFVQDLRDKEGLVLSLAATIAEDVAVQHLLARRERGELYDLMLNTYVRLRKDFHIEHIHFHVPPGISFLRVHKPEMYGDELGPERKTVIDALKDRQPKSGIEQGKTGYGIRAVVPIFYARELAGSVEVSYSFGAPYLFTLHKRWGMDLSFYSRNAGGEWRIVAQASEGDEPERLEPELANVAMARPLFMVDVWNQNRAILLVPVKDYSDSLIGLLKFSLDRTETKRRLAHSRNVMIASGLVGIGVSFFLTYLVAMFLIRPIEEIVREAQEIAEEKRERHIEPKPGDEIGRLAEALNLMLDSLKEKRTQLEVYARTLEKRVEERTADLLASEEKYRTLVENVPLIVYRILQDGTTEFVNSYLTEILGYSIEEAVGNKTFWLEKIWGCRPAECREVWQKNFEMGDGYRIERDVRDRNGRVLTFIDHAIPKRDGRGNVRWVDGIMMDITELKSFQEMALRAEEIRLLEEISAHMAHAIRNPLSSAGGFARRLQGSLPGNDPNRRLAEIIVKEVARIEDFLKVLFSSIRPFDLSLGEVDVNRMLQNLLARFEGPFRSKEIEVRQSFSPGLPKIQADEERLGEALENILKHASVLATPKQTLTLSTSFAGDRIAVEMTHRSLPLSQDDMDKFFFPHIEERAQWPIIDLSLSRRIIHRHGGKIDVLRQENDGLLMRIEMPVRTGR